MSGVGEALKGAARLIAVVRDVLLIAVMIVGLTILKGIADAGTDGAAVNDEDCTATARYYGRCGE